MTITIKKTQEITTQVELPDYFTTLSGWYYKTLPDNKVLYVTEGRASVENAESCLKYVMERIVACTQDQFVQAYCEAINAVSAASGIVHLPLKMEVCND